MSVQTLDNGPLMPSEGQKGIFVSLGTFIPSLFKTQSILLSSDAGDPSAP